MFVDDFAYDRSHNVRPRRNIRQVSASLPFHDSHPDSNSPPAPCLPTRGSALVFAGDAARCAVLVGGRFTRHSMPNCSRLPSNRLVFAEISMYAIAQKEGEFCCIYAPILHKVGQAIRTRCITTFGRLSRFQATDLTRQSRTASSA